ncbi:phosphoserine phosphatase SerB [Ferrimonas balearica]|uniref:phosphoserine phosphatase SerB n=1 Tax=Ferrimonas balearica TaxID=44012 RepID=UPI001F475413|nr:phosphoserine phosphatase SerB [Ferrimonas balearica]MBY6093886.1 phosphoserine phosphatase SerB [Ferrimonas balearica]
MPGFAPDTPLLPQLASDLLPWQPGLPTLMLIGRHLTRAHADQVLAHCGALTVVVAETLPGGLERVGWQGPARPGLPQLEGECELQWLPPHLPSLSSPGLLLMDMDSTAISMECIDEIARQGGVYQQVATVTAEAMAGGLDFAESLRRRVAMLQGIPTSVLTELAKAPPLMPGLLTLCHTLKRHGWRLGLASGGFNQVAAAVADAAGIDRFEANELGREGAMFNGVVDGAIVDAARKAALLAEWGTEWQIPPAQWVAMGDGANDLPMLGEAALGVGVHAKPAVVAQADAAIQRLGLDAVLGLLRP